MIITFFKLMIGHAFGDFVFQSGEMSRGKRRSYKCEPPAGAKFQPTWVYWLTAHALVHGGMVWLMTGNVWLGLAETICHWAIDFGKCEKWYGVHLDQTMHITCKLIWSII